MLTRKLIPQVQKLMEQTTPHGIQPHPPAAGSACCERCKRPGILTCQYVIPNQWVESEKAWRCKPWVFRYHLCRYHLAAENHPKALKKFGGKKRVRLALRHDDELIEEWRRNQSQEGRITEKAGWQMPSKPNNQVEQRP